jgi:hypothetical protein
MLRQNDVVLGGPVGPLPGRFPKPDTLADARGFDSLADRVDRSGPILVRDDLREWKSAAAPAVASLPVRGVHARHGDGDANLARSGLGDRALDDAERVRPTGF